MTWLGWGPIERLGRRRSANGTKAKLKGRQSQFGFAPVVQTSTCSAIARASSTSTPRYLTVLSIFVCPNNSCTARRLPVRRGCGVYWTNGSTCADCHPRSRGSQDGALARREGFGRDRTGG